MGKNRRERRRLAKLAAGGGAASNVVALAPPSGELGVPGTINWDGRLHTEANTKLQWEKAYGQPGSTSWGEYEKLERTDHQVASALNLVSAPLRDSIVEVEPASEDEADVAMADFVRDNLTEWLEPRAPQLLEQQVRYGLGYGYHLGELVWDTRPDKRVPGGQATYLRKLAQRLPSSLASNAWVEKDGELRAIRQQGHRDGKWVDVELPSDKVLLCTWNRTGSNYQGFSAFRPVWYLAQMRADLLRILAIGHQRESCGVPVAEVDKDAALSDDQREELQSVLEDLVYHENAGLQLPPGVKLQWVFSPGANKGHVLETWRALGLAILETVQAQQQYLGTSDTGSRAVGEVHAQAQTAFVQGVRAWLEACWNGVGGQPYTGVIRKLVDFNFGAQEKYPLLRLVTKKAELPPMELATAVATLKGAGALTLTADDENDLRERLGLRPIDAEQRAAAAAKSAPLPPGADGEEASGTPSPKATSFSLGFTPSRPLRPEEECLALEEMDGFLDGTTDATEEALKKAVEQTIKALLPEVKAALADGNPSELRHLEVDADLIAQAIEAAAEKSKAFGFAQAEKEKKRGTGKLEKERARGKPGVSAAPVKFEEDDGEAAPEKPGIAPNKALDAHVEAATERVAQRVKAAVWDEAVKAAARGSSAESVVETTWGLFDESKLLRSESGSLVNTAFGIGRSAFLYDNRRAVGSVLYSAILDEDACDECLSEDGKEFPLFSAEHLAHETPYPKCEGKSRCRCLLLPQWKDDA